MLKILFLLINSVIAAKNRAVVIDAGSTGTRIHVTTWTAGGSRECGKLGIQIQLPILTWKQSPGIITYIENSSENKDVALEKYLDNLYTGLTNNLIPNKSDQQNVPVWFLGTGGMRGVKNVHLIVNRIKNILETKWDPFITSHNRSVDIITGQEEAVYSWITLLHILNQEIKNDSLESLSFKQLKHRPIMIELGGASTQIVLPKGEEPTQPFCPVRNDIFLGALFDTSSNDWSGWSVNGPNYIKLNLCGEFELVYARSYQGYGRQLAFQKYLCMGKEESKLPCLPMGLRFPINCDLTAVIEDIGIVDHEDIIQGIRGILNNDYHLCKSKIKELLFIEDIKIPFNVSETTEIIATESYYHLYSMVLDPYGKFNSVVTLDQFRHRAKELCKLQNIEKITPLLHSKAEHEKAITACFGLTFAADLLENILNISSVRPIKIINNIKNIDLGWTIGHNLLELPHWANSFKHILYDEL